MSMDRCTLAAGSPPRMPAPERADAERSDWGSTGRYCCRAPRGVSRMRRAVARRAPRWLGATITPNPQEAQLLHRSDSSSDGGAPIDLPLREEVPATWEATPPAQRYLFESTA